MGGFIATSKEEQEQMLRRTGFHSINAMFEDIPKEIRLIKSSSEKQAVLSKDDIRTGTYYEDLDYGKSEQYAAGVMKKAAARNHVFPAIFRGAGAYYHYIPAVVSSVTAKESLVTAYTPYQAEISQGVLQAIFEYQTMMCELTGMDVSNAGVYDGATAAAEAVTMCRDKKKNKVLVSECAPPQVIQTIKTYCNGNGTKVVMIPKKGLETDLSSLNGLMDDTTCAVYLQQPNYYGSIERIEEAASLIHNLHSRLILGVNPVSLAVLKTPHEYGADIAVGEAQPLGLPMSYGGPYLGFMTCTREMMRKLPGRIVGETTDQKGNTGYVLTLQAREQHIRREKASSNICSNQALCCLSVHAYLSVLGTEGLIHVAQSCISNAHYLAYLLEKAGYCVKNQSEFFHEFVTEGNHRMSSLLSQLEKKDILGGLLLSDNSVLWCCTEQNTRQQIETVAQIAKEVMQDDE